jgi:hypothetical protein
MAESIVVSCPECKKKMKVPAQAVGKRVRCVKCQTPIKVEAPAPAQAALPAKPAAQAAPKPPPVKFEADDGPASYGLIIPSEDEDGEAAPPPPPPPKPAEKPNRFVDPDDANPYGVTDTDLAARCPFCAKEMESAEAVICLNCGYNTITRIRAGLRVVHAITFMDWVKWWSPAIGCLLGIAALCVLDWWFCIYLNDMWKEWDEWIGTSSFTRGIRLWEVVPTVWVMWQAAKFAFKRLILNPRPPEVENKEAMKE